MKIKIFKLLFLFAVLTGLTQNLQSQIIWDDKIEGDYFRHVLEKHKELVSIPNLPESDENMMKNVEWVSKEFKDLNYEVKVLESSTLPILFLEKNYDSKNKTVLYYFHLDGQPVNPDNWNQKNPFEPVLKQKNEDGSFTEISWDKINGKIDDDWRVFGRAAADDKAPIIMFLAALNLLEKNNLEPEFNVKVVIDLQEEYNSDAFLSTLDKYKNIYASDYMIIMDGPAHTTNKPTLTFGCRGVATCTITTFGSKLPQHSGHYGNYVANPVFGLSRILSTIKDENGKVLIKGYYDGIEISPEVAAILNAVPDEKSSIDSELMIAEAESVGNNYQESLQYPSFNVRQIGTSWNGDKPKTVIPEYAIANIDVRLVKETDGQKQLDKIQAHLVGLGYHVIDRDPTDEERLKFPKLVKFIGTPSVNAFRTEIDSDFGNKLRAALTKTFNEEPVIIRTMGGTVPIIDAIQALDVPAIIVPMVNMDNNQHNPNENIRIGNIREGIKICLSLFQTEL
ncbi:Acetylornithine deacetylase/Succinyl-diaminopimelate desuccinylase [Flavobacteriaceae bacterium MAR_2010_188]|nr:Acetylornithine deacetylase/Succinyl-diaminopimelate desuccinylase [Flavobacteriaceae bacterium MAR_2010_188]